MSNSFIKEPSVLLGLGLVLMTNVINTQAVYATIYKCEKSNGTVYYNDKPCVSDDVETELKHVKPSKNISIAKTMDSEKAENSKNASTDTSIDKFIKNNSMDSDANSEKARIKASTFSETTNNDADSAYRKELLDSLGLDANVEDSIEELEKELASIEKESSSN